MTIFLRLLADADKGAGLSTACARLRQGETDPRLFEVAPEAFDAVPGKPFAYWVSNNVRSIFPRFPMFEEGERKSSGGIGSTDDFRFIRTWWEVSPSSLTTNQHLATERKSAWVPIAQGGGCSPFYSKILSVIQFGQDGIELKSFIEEKLGSASRNVRAQSYYFKAGLTWPLRGEYFSSWPLPAGSVFSVAGKMAYAPRVELLYWLAIFNSKPFDYLLRLFAGKVGGVQYESGLIGELPVPMDFHGEATRLTALARQGWQLKRSLDFLDELSHAFRCPRLSDYDPPMIEAALAKIQAEIDALAFDLYGFDEADRIAALSREELTTEDTEDTEEEEEREDE